LGGAEPITLAIAFADTHTGWLHESSAGFGLDMFERQLVAAGISHAGANTHADTDAESHSGAGRLSWHGT
jgi:hypothetical protein